MQIKSVNASHKNQRFFYFSESVKNSGEKLQMPSSCLFYNFLYTWWRSKELKKYINRIPKSISSHQSFLFCAELSFDYYVPHMPSVIANFFREAKNWSFLERRQASPAFLLKFVCAYPLLLKILQCFENQWKSLTLRAKRTTFFFYFQRKDIWI